jgi:TusA-related sulfurtransferase
MKTIKVDARGLDCPEPVILSKKALSDIEQGDVIVQVDSEVAKENIARMAKHEGCAVTIKEHGKQGFELHLTKPEPGEKHRASETRAKGDEESVAYLFDSDFIGTNRELGKILVNGFLNAISSLPHKKIPSFLSAMASSSQRAVPTCLRPWARCMTGDMRC